MQGAAFRQTCMAHGKSSVQFTMRYGFIGCGNMGSAMIGENLLDVVEKKDNNRANQVFAQISESRVGRCVRTADYLYSVYAPGVNGGEAAASELYADDFLYDLKADPWQLNNVVTDPAYEAVKQDMRARLLDWIEKAEGMRPTIVD